ncbi:MAG: DNA repair protein RecO [Candidatus Nealsonbacteria bacterium]|nr:DNA repair protein RecO [Candidatus Nealsonbacteria bacterium]
MFVHYRTLGFVLKKEDRGESDQLFTIFTKNFGKLKILGKSIRKIKSKLRASIQPFYLAEVEFIQGKVYKTLTDAVRIERFKKIEKDLDKLKTAVEISEISDRLIKGEERDKKIGNLILEAFKRLNNCPSRFNFIVFYYFLWNFFSILGYCPETEKCIFCRKRLLPKNLYFDSEQGGVICGNCFKKTKKGEKINPETIKFLRVFLKKNWKILSKLKTKGENNEELKEISEKYLSHLSNTLDIS